MINNITEKRRTGNLGEDVSCTYLVQQGFTVLDRNYLKKFGELDIVAIKEGQVHFIEVKTVTRITDGYKPEDNLHVWKLKRLARTIQAYILEKKVKNEWQFDVITIVLNMKTRRAKVDFMQNIIL